MTTETKNDEIVTLLQKRLSTATKELNEVINDIEVLSLSLEPDYQFPINPIYGIPYLSISTVMFLYRRGLLPKSTTDE